MPNPNSQREAQSNMSRIDELAKPKLITKKYVPKVRIWKQINHPVIPVQSPGLDRLCLLSPVKITPKYVPKERLWIEIQRPIIPDHTPILERLTHQHPRMLTKKWTPPPFRITNIHPSVLKAKPTPRTKDLAKAYPRIVKATRNMYCPAFDKKWCDKLRKRVNSAWNTMYMVPIKMKLEKMKRRMERQKREELRQKRRMKSRIKVPEPRLPILEKPKKVPKPKKTKRGPKTSIKYLRKHLERIVKLPAHRQFKSPSQTSMAKYLEAEEKRAKYARNYKASKRIKELAIMPKFKQYRVESEIDFMHVRNRWALLAVASKRLRELAEPKKDFRIPEEILDVTEYNVIRRALKYRPTKRIKILAIAKIDLSVRPRTLPIPVSENAKKGKASARTKELAKPKKDFGSKPRPLPTPISDDAKNATASPRTSELATPKKDFGSKPRPVPTPVSEYAMKHEASERTKQLAQPKLDWKLVHIHFEEISDFHTHWHKAPLPKPKLKKKPRRDPCKKYGIVWDNEVRTVLDTEIVYRKCTKKEKYCRMKYCY